MRVFFDYKQFDVPSAVITVGVFDGVHRGHVEILKRLRDVALANHAGATVVTFWPHPRLVLGHDTTIRLINTLEEKQHMLEKNGVDNLVVIPFTEEFSRLSSDEFVKDVLVDKLHVRHLIVGYNHHFGRGREGNFEVMQKYAAQYGFTIEQLGAQLVGTDKVSSTMVRKALVDGDVRLASQYLGYPYELSGIVVEGNKLGRNIGFPTANLKVEDPYKLVPAPGVYAVRAEMGENSFEGMLNIGYKPTVNSLPAGLTIEVHLFNFSGDLYHKHLTVLFYERVRNELKFDSLDHLKNQLINDKKVVTGILHALR